MERKPLLSAEPLSLMLVRCGSPFLGCCWVAETNRYMRIYNFLIGQCGPAHDSIIGPLRRDSTLASIYDPFQEGLNALCTWVKHSE